MLARMVVLGSVLAVVAASGGPCAAADATPPLDGPAAERKARNTANKEGHLQLPLPGTPDPKTLTARLAAVGVLPGDPVMIRIFKQESELEIWMQRGATYTRFATYPICYFSGGLGPKQREGDRQTPEGFYTITELHDGGRWPRSLDVNFPNALDVSLGRSGYAILIHGGCNSIGCFAMTNAVNAEIYDLVAAAFAAGSTGVPVQIFPFRMTEENLVTYAAGSKWLEYWSRLKQGYDSFERTHLPPRVEACNQRYLIADRETVGAADRAPACAPPPGAIVDALVGPPPQPPAATEVAAAAVAEAKLVQTSAPDTAAKPRVAVRASPKRYAQRCSASRPSCRRWTAMRQNRGIGKARRADAAVPVRRAYRTVRRARTLASNSD